MERIRAIVVGDVKVGEGVYGLRRVIWLVVPSTTYFSFVFGTHVFLRCEVALRNAIRVVARKSQKQLLGALSTENKSCKDLDSSHWERVERLTGLYRSLTDDGLRSAIPSAISLALPLLGPAVAVWTIFMR